MREMREMREMQERGEREKAIAEFLRRVRLS